MNATLRFSIRCIRLVFRSTGFADSAFAWRADPAARTVGLLRSQKVRLKLFYKKAAIKGIQSWK